MKARAKRLIELAESKFKLSTSEYNLLLNIANGGKPSDKSDESNNELNIIVGDAERDENYMLRASLITWLCIDMDACKFITNQGISITGAEIKEPLNLDFVTLEFPLVFHYCYFQEVVKINHATLKLLDFSNSQINSSGNSYSIEARNLKISGSIILNSSILTGGICLEGATVGGNFDCENGEFDNPKGIAINLKNSEIRGSVLLSYGFKACGTVSLYNAFIGSLECDGGSFYDEESAINAEDTKIRGTAFFRDEFKIIGELSLAGAEIGGDLICTNATFENPSGNALSAPSVEVKGSVSFIQSKFEASEIAVWLTGAIIGRDLECNSGKFYSAKGSAIIFHSGSVGACIFLIEEFEAHGQVSLYGTTISNDLECQNSTFKNPERKSLLAEGIEVKGSILIEDCKIEGSIWINSATIGGSFRYIGSKLNNPEEEALLIQNTNVKSSVTLGKNLYTDQRFEVIGEVSMTGTVISGNLECNGGKILNREGNSLSLQGARIGRSVLLQDCSFIGIVSLTNATVNNAFRLMEIREPEGMLLNLTFARIQTLINHPSGWPKQNYLLLDGLTLEKVYRDLLDYNLQLNWLRLQPENRFSFQPYEQLSKIFRESGLEDGAKEILIAKEKDRRIYRKLNWFSKIANWILDFTIAYGYKTYRVLSFASIFIITGTFLFWIGYLESPQLISPSKVHPFYNNFSKSVELSEYYPSFNPFFYSLDTFMPIVNLHQQDYWLPNVNRERFIDIWPPPPIWSPSRREHVQIFLFKFRPKFKGAYLRWYMWFHIIAGWFFTSLGVAGLTGLVRRIN